MKPVRKSAKSVFDFFKDNSLSLAFAVLFVICLVGQAITGYLAQFEDPAASKPISGFFGYLVNAGFLQGIFTNWQAALLQLMTLIIFAIFLRQRGAAHSRKPDDEPKKDEGSSKKEKTKDTEREDRRDGPGSGGGAAEPEEKKDKAERPTGKLAWIYENSLSLAFLACFLLTFLGHYLSSHVAYNSERSTLHEAPVGLGEYAVSAKFWFLTLQTWEAEFFAIGLYLVLSIFLRQHNSAESKRVDAEDDDTGETNE